MNMSKITVERVNDTEHTTLVKIENSYILSAEDIELIRKILKDDGWIEFRRHEESEDKEIDMCYRLCESKILEVEMMAWHQTFILTDIGKDVAKQLFNNE